MKANVSPLISASELHQQLDDPQVTIVDLRGRWGPPQISCIDAYKQGHIPGATYLDWTRYLLTQNMPVSLAPVASQSQAQRDFDALGVSSTDLVVLYDDYHHMLAGRIWWAMRFWGFTNVKVLDGGWKHWVAQGLPISTDIPAVKHGKFIVKQQPEWRVDIHDVAHRADDVCLLDARGEARFNGTVTDATTGHIPKAINTPFSLFLDAETGTFKDVEALKRIFTERSIAIDTQQLMLSCGSGYAATVVLLVLSKLGVNVPLFDGSFAEWKANNMPIELNV